MKKRRLFKFRIYIAGDALNSTAALCNLKAFCRAHLPNKHEIEVVDVFTDPERALTDGIYMTPTLVKLLPFPRKTIVGTLSHSPTLVLAFGLRSGEI